MSAKPINHFVRRMELIDTLQVRRRYEDMYDWLLVTHGDFDKTDQKEEIASKLEGHIKEIQGINGRNYNHTLQLRANRGAKIFFNGGYELKKRIYEIMWTGYINKADFSFWDPSGGRKSDAELKEWAKKQQT